MNNCVVTDKMNEYIKRNDSRTVWPWLQNGGWARWGPKEVTDKLVPTVAGSVE